MPRQNLFLQLITLLILNGLVKSETELLACERDQCLCSDKFGRLGKTLYCPRLTDSAINIDYERTKSFDVQCLNNETFVEDLDFNLTSIPQVQFVDCRLPNGLKFFKKWNLIEVKVLILERIFDLGTKETITNSYFDNVPKGTIEKLHFKSSGIKAIERDAFKGFDRLTSLDFENNRLVKILDIFKNIPNLRNLDLQQNQIEDLPEGITGEKLQILYLNYNKISSLREDTFSKTPNITLLELSANDIVNLPRNLLRNLKRLQRVHFWLGGPINITDLFSENHNLKSIRFRGGLIDFFDPKAFFNLTELNHLDLFYTKLNQLPEGLFENNRKLEHIMLTNNGLNQLPKGLFKNNEMLKEIKLCNNDLTDLPDGIFEPLTNLTSLELSGNRLKEWKKEYFGKGLRNLEELELTNNNLERLGHLVFVDLPKLRTLSINNNSLSDVANEAFDERSSIQNLYLNSNNLSSDGFNYLTNLKVFELNNNLFDDIPDLGAKPFLNRLSMRSNRIDKIDLLAIQNVKNVDLSNNKISTVDLTIYNSVFVNATRPEMNLDLNGNPFDCNCKAFQFLRLLARDDPRTKIDVEDLRCSEPTDLSETLVKDVSVNDLKCDLKASRSFEEYPCPIGCRCELIPTSRELNVDCSNSGLTEVPRVEPIGRFYYYGVVYNSTFVNLSGNFIERFGESSGYRNISGLDLSGNLLEVVDWVPDGLYSLQLHRNKLEGIDDLTLEKLKNSSNLRLLSLHENPWNCNCSMVKLANASRSVFKFVLKNSETIKCIDGQFLIHATETDLCPDFTVLITVIAIAIASLVIFTITLYACFKYQTAIKIWLYYHKIFLRFVTEEEIDKSKKYDAFVSYSHKDEAFIAKHLLPQLEGNPNPYKLCYHERDWEVGEFINKQIIDSVNNSRRTIIVLSKNFLESTWASMEFQTAHEIAMKEKRNRLIVILYDDVKPEDIEDEELKSYLRTNTYIKWGDPWFWKKLRFALPHRNPKAEKAKQRIENIMITIDDKLDLTGNPTTPNTQTPPVKSLDNPLLLKGGSLEFKPNRIS